jgi:hypothetical protein
MRVLLNLVVMMAFLFTATHIVVDHSGGGRRASVFISHLGAFHVDGDEDKHEPSGAHDPNHDPYHHDADSHCHFEWYTTTVGSDAPLYSMVPVAIHGLPWAATEPLVGSTPVYRKAPEHPPPRAPLYLQYCSLLS